MNIEAVQEHAVKIKKLLVDVSNHLDVINQHDGELKIWFHPVRGQWEVQSVKMIVDMEDKQ